MLSTEDSSLIPSQIKLIEAKLLEREEFLEAMYHQVAVKFADLHDTPGGMMAKGCISVRKFSCMSKNNQNQSQNCRAEQLHFVLLKCKKLF